MSSGGTIHIADGIYSGTNNRNITIGKNMTIIGVSQTGTIINADNHGRIFSINIGITVTIQNLTFRNRNATEFVDYGGIILNEGNLAVTDSTFTNNTSSNYEGANYNIYGYGTLPPSNPTIPIIPASIYGGAIANNGGTLNVTSSTFTNNAAKSGSAIYNYKGTLNVTDSLFKDNTANLSCAIDNNGGTLTVTNSIFINNTDCAINNGWGGNSTITSSTFINNGVFSGAIHNRDGTLTVTDSTFTNNTAYVGGAIISGGTSTVTGSTFKGNNANNNGGAIRNMGELNVINSTFNGNNAKNNGGAIENLGTLTVSDSTFTGNNATDRGGSIYNTGALTIHFSRIVGNTASRGSAIYSSGFVNAENNWWGSNTNPKNINRLIAGLIGDVDADPWLVLTVTADSNSIQVGGSSTIIADLLHDSNGNYHDPQYGHVPDGAPVTFTTTKGTINPILSNLLNGNATSIFTSSTPSTAIITTTVDNQPLLTQITIGITNTTVNHVSGYAGQNIALEATVTGSAVNEGQVKYTVNNLVIGTANVVNGVASLNWKIPANWKAGTYKIVAKYLGTAKYQATNGTSTLTIKPTANMVFVKAVSKGTHYYGDTIHYYLTMKNNGPDSATGIYVFDKLPTGLKYLSSSATKGSYKLSTNKWTIGTLKAGQTAKLNLKVLIKKAGTIKNTVKLTYTTNPKTSITRSISFNVPKAVPLAELIKASSKIKKYYETHNNRLPTNLKVAGQTLTMPQLLKLLTTATINISKKNLKPISVKIVGKAPYYGGSYTTGKLYNYISIARNISTFINNNKIAPNYVQTTLGRITFSKLVYMYSKVVNSYGKQKKLPRYVTT